MDSSSACYMVVRQRAAYRLLPHYNASTRYTRRAAPAYADALHTRVGSFAAFLTFSGNILRLVPLRPTANSPCPR